MKRWIPIVTICLALVGCAAPVVLENREIVLNQEQIASMVRSRPQRLQAAREQLSAMSAEEAVRATRAKLENKTKVIFQDGHGVQVEYTAADGTTWLWYHGNRSAVRGAWDVRVQDGKPVVCFGYNNAFNPVTGRMATNDCWSLAATLGEVDEIDSRSGDPFNLASGRIPYRRAYNAVPNWPDVEGK